MADTKWKPGQSGNPKGRQPRRKCLSDALYHLLTKHDDANAIELAEKIFELGRGGDVSAIKLMWEYVEGKAPQPIEGTDGPPIAVVEYRWSGGDADVGEEGR